MCKECSRERQPRTANEQFAAASYGGQWVNIVEEKPTPIPPKKDNSGESKEGETEKTA